MKRKCSKLSGRRRERRAAPLHRPAEASDVAFVTMAGALKDSRTSDFDGLLTMGLFTRAFIDHADRFAVLEAW
jgi:hypothetical protein